MGDKNKKISLTPLTVSFADMPTMTKSKTIIILAVMVFFSLTGCTSRAWYEGFREAARQRCYQLNNEDDIQRCLEDIESGTYEEYQQSRQQ